MTTNLINKFKLFSNDECARLCSGLPNIESVDSFGYSQALERGVDDSWFDVIMTSVKNNNRMKISISSISKLTLNVHGMSSIYKNDMDWAPSELGKKMRVFIPVSSCGGMHFSVSIGSVIESFDAQQGYGYSWPAWATLNSESSTNYGLINVDGTVIGKKLT